MKNPIDILVTEHDNILRMLDVVHRAALKILQGAPVNTADFRKIVAFIRQYADFTHHGKEEAFLFSAMTDELGDMGDNLIRHGMLVEHDLARLYVSDLEAGLNACDTQPGEEARLAVLIAAGSYEQLLRRHIQKENDVIFPYGANNISSAAFHRVQTQVEDFETEPENFKVRERQLSVLRKLETKYGGRRA